MIKTTQTDTLRVDTDYHVSVDFTTVRTGLRPFWL